MILLIPFAESDGAMKSDDDILDIASSRIAALAMISSSDGNYFTYLSNATPYVFTEYMFYIVQECTIIGAEKESRPARTLISSLDESRKSVFMVVIFKRGLQLNDFSFFGIICCFRQNKYSSLP